MIYLKKTATALLGSLVATALFAFVVSMACRPRDAEKAGTPAADSPTAVQLVNAFPNLTFEQPVEFTHAGDGTNRVFVVEQAGRIRSFTNDPAAKSAGVYLDIRDRVEAGGEMGLLGLAFHPNFRQNGYFFVNYTKNNPRETVISRFKASSASADKVDPGSEVVLLKFRQPYSNHNGGKVAFGPDGMLYIATGDGGSANDPQNNGQNRATYLGKILRIDVNKTDKGNYGIPADNPFVNQSDALGEIYAYGLRNPWRFSFDPQTGQLWTGDVGQNELEEIDIVTKGGNYGWRIMEARNCFNPKADCDRQKLIEPIHQYRHGSDGNSVTGGVVYRGKGVSDLQGKYIFGDFGSGKVWALSHNGKQSTGNQLLTSSGGNISAFGEDANRELYVLDHVGGVIRKFGNK
ncbi:PQQ-dependent sugar dehydrogenase [Tellurirhabdus rosea]|uniref:PQQ-dependent sugar dehydrogenase n=1 Tax=Tellurirhabdus rosea TaxID=2674997 RepID=UPI00224DFF78|nr:PQQ-dependent sugar dehydrogenase [Tellurirhabdus rosea]